MKVILEYSESTGAISDKLGTVFGTWHNLEHFGEPDNGAGVRDIIKMKEAGFTAEDIVAMKEGGVL